MNKRWLAGILLFVLGFGCSSLVKLATASTRAAVKEGVIEGGLRYVDGTDLSFQYSEGDSTYLFVEARKPDVLSTEPPIAYSTGSTTLSKQALQSVAMYRLTLVGVYDGQRVCFPPNWTTECPSVRPLPPRPPIRATDLVTRYLDPTKLVPGPMGTPVP